MREEIRNTDVVVVGYGPVGKLAALMLARKGHRVHVLERWDAFYDLPRAVCMDHEIRRLLNSLGFSDVLDTLSVPSPRYQWFGAKGDMLLDIDWTIEAISGGPEAYFFHQPSLEAALDAAVRAEERIELSFQTEFQQFVQDAEGVSVEAHNPDGTPLHLRAKYLIGADGANSRVREQAGMAWHDLGFAADWLVVDVMPEGPEALKVDVATSAGQRANPERPTTYVPGGRIDGKLLRRWEFMCLPDERKEDMATEETAWRLLEPWVHRDRAELIRQAVYTFRSLVADRWTDGRVAIAGDAAHLMPPFMGQGMCSGMRDAAALAWRLDLLLRGLARPDLLDSYSTERRAHVTDIVNISVYLGKVICVADPEEAARRDASFLDGSAEPAPPFPILQEGLLHNRADPFIGQLAPHGMVQAEGQSAPLDSLLPPGFTLMALGADPRAGLPPVVLDALDRLGCRFLEVTPEGGAPGPSTGGAGLTRVRDVTGKFAAWFAAAGASHALVRPDFYVYGLVSDAEDLGALCLSLISAVGAALAEIGRSPAQVRSA